MLNYLLDTNVISELRKGSRGDVGVQSWFEQAEEDTLFTSVLVIGEIRRGIENIRRRNPQSANHLDLWLSDLLEHFSSRIIGIDQQTAEIWGQLNSIRPLPVIDSLLAATAKAHKLVLVTRNVKDIQQTDVRWLNPFQTA